MGAVIVRGANNVQVIAPARSDAAPADVRQNEMRFRAQMQEELAANAKMVGDLSRRIFGALGSAQELIPQLEALNVATSQLIADVDQLIIDVNNAVDEIGDQGPRVTDLENRADNADAARLLLAARLVEVEGAVEILEGRADNAANARAIIVARLTAAENAATALDTRVGTVETSAADLQTRMAAAEGLISAIDGRTASLETRVGDNETAIAGLIAVKDDHESRITALEP